MAAKAKKEITAKGGKYSLRQGHEMPFRRTIHYSDSKSAQLVFNPGVTYELTELEVDQCQDIIDSHLLVEATEDEKGRVRYISRLDHDKSSDAIISDLEKKVETLSAENAELRALAKGTENADNTTTKADHEHKK
jgi:hypothetical protein